MASCHAQACPPLQVGNLGLEKKPAGNFDMACGLSLDPFGKRLWRISYLICMKEARWFHIKSNGDQHAG